MDTAGVKLTFLSQKDSEKKKKIAVDKYPEDMISY